MLLWKYQSRQRIPELPLRTLRFTQPRDFNDPFEAWPEFASLVCDEADWADRVLSVFQADNARLWHMLAGTAQNMPSLEDFIELVETRDAQTLRELARLHSVIFQRASETPFLQDAEIGVLCLCEVADDLRMWSMYADSHRGIALGFDSDHPWFHNDEPSHFMLAASPVVYAHRRPTIELSVESVSRTLLTKAKAWEYEREWRVVRDLKAAWSSELTPIDDRIEKVSLFRYPPEALREVVLGARTSPTDASLVARSLSRPSLGANPLRHVRLRSATLHPSNHSIEVNDPTSH